MMKTIKIFLVIAILSVTSLTHNSCTENFVEINSDSRTVYTFEPMALLYDVARSTRSSSWEWYYDFYTAQMRWVQYGARVIGNLPTVYTIWNPNIGEQRYRICWLGAGSYAKHIEYYIDANHANEKGSYSNLIEAAKVILIYQGILTSDMYGSLAYTEGWSLRSGGDITEPKFDSQKELYDIWNTELKEAISKFKSNQNQKSLAGYDVAYNGDISKWIKAANGLRLRIALRLLKQDPAKAKAIAAEVLGNPSEIMSGTGDSFIFWHDGRYTDNGDYFSINDLIRASRTMMNYLNKFEDPRRRMYFRINNLSPENVAAFNQANPTNQIPASFGRWEGGTANPDAGAADPKYIRKTLEPTGRAIDMQAVNKPQTRIFAGHFDGGSGGSWFPNVTYADFCFMAAEFTLLGVSNSKSAEQWYTNGVSASLDQWSQVGAYCKIHDYQAITADEKATFMEKPGIKWDPAKGLEQIYSQTYIEHFKNSNEAWALWKRTGYPTTTSDIVALEDVFVGQVKQQMPRRLRFTYPMEGTPNYENYKKRIDDMKTDPDFGEPTSEYGRVWWDKK
jgi:hypothetical protein